MDAQPTSCRSVWLANLVLVAAPAGVLSFSTPPKGRRAFVVGTKSPFGGASTSAATEGRRGGSRSSDAHSSRLFGHLAYLDSLNSIADNPDLFPTTSGYVRALSRLDSSASGAAAAPSPEEFLTKLSEELLRASRDGVGVRAEDVAGDRVGGTDYPSFFRDVAEQSVPAATAAAGVSVAAQNYNPSMYSHLLANNDHGGVPDLADTHEPILSVASDLGAISGSADYDVPHLSSNGNEFIGGGMPSSESFASWHSQGGSNALRDLASAIPVEVEQQGVNYVGDYGLSDYVGSGGYYLADYTEVGHLGGNDVSSAANAFATSSLELGDVSTSYAGGVLADANGLDGAFTSISNYLASIQITPPPATQHAMSTFRESNPKLEPLISAMSKTLDGLGDKVADVTNSLEVVSGEIGKAADAGVSSAKVILSGQMGKVAEAGVSSAKVVGNAIQSGAVAVGEKISGLAPSAETISAGAAGVVSSVKNKVESLEMPNYEFNLQVPTMPEASSLAGIRNEMMTEDIAPPKEMLDMKSTLPKVNPQLSESPAMSVQAQGVPAVETEMTLPKAEPVIPEQSASPELPDLNPPVQTLQTVDITPPDLPDAAMPLPEDVQPPVVELQVETLPEVSTQPSVLPDMNLQAPALPEVNVQPDISQFKMTLPDVNLPHVNLRAPTLPTIDDLPKVNLELPTMPKIDMHPPALPNLNNVPQFQPPSLPNVDVHPPAMPHLDILEGTNSVMKSIGDSSLADFGNGVIAAFRFMGGIIVHMLDFILGAAAGTSVASLLTNVQASVTSVIENASHTVVSTINNIGDLSLKDIVQHSMALIVATTDVFLKIMNAVVYLISGRDGASWALQASSLVSEASSQLLAQTTIAYDDFTHASLREMTQTVGDFSQQVGHELLAVIGNLNGMASDGSVSVDGVPMDADMLDGITAAVQTFVNL